MSSSIEMNNSVTVNSLLMKSLESATREYARKCVTRLAVEYGFSEEDALKTLNLENLKLQVQEMKKRSGGKAKAKEVKAKPEKAKKVAKALFPLPFSKENVLETGCQGLAYNNGLFTQCPKSCIESLNYCKGCQSEIDKNGLTTNGTVAQRLACELMEFKDPKGRKPVAYMKIMEKQKLNRDQVEAEAGKLNISIDEIHFVVGSSVSSKKKKTVKEVVEDDLLADLLEELLDSDEETNEVEKLEEVLNQEGEKNVLQDEEKALKAQKKQQQDEEKALKAQKKQQQDEEKALKAAEVAEKKQKQDEEKAAKEAEVALKKQKIAEEKAAKEQKIAEEKVAKEQKIAEEKAAKEAEVALKKQKIADEKAAKEQKIAEEKAAKEQKIAEEKALKKQQQEDEKAAKKEAPKPKEKKQKEGTKTIVATKANFKVGDKVKHSEKGVETIAIVTEVKMGKSFVEYELRVDDERVFVAPEGNIMIFKEPETSAPKKVTVKRITINGKQYLKTAANLLYDPDTKEEMGIYDPETNTIKELPNDSEDELSEDDMSDDE